MDSITKLHCKYNTNIAGEKILFMRAAVKEISKIENPCAKQAAIAKLAEILRSSESTICADLKHFEEDIIPLPYFCPIINDDCKGRRCQLFDNGCSIKHASVALRDLSENGITTY